MPLDARKNFAKGTVSTGYAAGATSIALTTGHAARFPAVPFNATWWNSTDYANAADDPNREIVRVTAIASDTLTITRAQESTADSSKNEVGKTYTLLAGPTAQTITDIETDLAAKETPAGAQAKADAAQTAAIAASQPVHANLTAESGLTGAADRVSYYTGVGAKALATLTAFGRSLIAAADLAALKVILALTKSDVGLGNVTNDAQLKASDLSTDGTFAANSDTLIPSQKAVKTYADQLIASTDAMVFKGVVDCSSNPNYPAADRGHTYRVSVAGKIGGASGINVEAGDLLLCLTDGTASGNQATVGTAWAITQTNLDGAVIGPASATDSHFAQFDGTSGKLIKGGLALDTDGTLAANSATRVPSQSAVKTYADAVVGTILALGTWISGATGKTTPVDADSLPLSDSAASNALKKLTWADLKATLKAYFDTLYQPLRTVLTHFSVAEADVASATTCDIGAAATDNVRITGTTTITGLGTVAAGTRRFVRFAGALTLTHNATSLILPTAGSNITTADGDSMVAVSLGSGNWKVLQYQKVNGTALVGGGGGSVSDSVFGASWNGDTTNAPSKNVLWDWMSEPASITFVGTSGQFTNLPASIGFWAGTTGHQYVQKFDLTNKTQVRFLANKQNVAGSAGSKIVLRYNASLSTTASAYSDLGTSAVELAVDTATVQILDSGWIDLAAGAKGVVFVALQGYGGDGATDPTFGTVQAQFR